ncbi:serine type site-specific recombinase [Puia dinghuensis]|uniref:Serine type site-specific recombinase n=1 Tax=Puia dinghuensis TaxID=1792502 RepID=A0A8J2UA22_9BACT|nr:serine type site-specific recombinase [Puia dinghuensis]
MKTELSPFSSFAKMPRKTTSYVETNFVITYSRVSTKEQHDKNLSLETQTKAFEEHARRTGKTIVASFGGTYESAKTDGRKEFQRMLTFIKKSHRKISQIWVYMTDRFSRTGGGAIKLAEELREKYGVTIYAICQPTDTRDESGIFNQNLQFLFSHYDNRLRRKRVIDGMKAKFERGEWVVMPPQGYDIVWKNSERKIVINAEGRKIRKAFQWKAEGMKNEEIIERLQALGMPMYKQQLTKIFKRPFYCGILAHGLLEGKVVEGKHEPLVSKEIFLRVNNIHQQSPNYGVPHKKEQDELPLKIFVKCGDCGQPFTGYLMKARGLYYYKCRTNGCKCNKSAKQLHGLFSQQLESIAAKEEAKQAIQYELENFYYDVSKDSFETQTTLKARLTEITHKLDTLQECFFIEKTMDRETFEKFNARYQKEKAETEEQLGECSVTISNIEDCIREAVDLATKLNTVWASSGIKQKEALQKLIFPQGIAYDRKNGAFRTEEMNFIFALIEANSGDSEGNKKRTNALVERLSLSAEREGFEPSVRLPAQRFSRPPQSTALPPLQRD